MVVPNDKYTAAAFKAEVDNVRNAPEGTRNHQLFSSTAACAEFCNAGTLSEDTVRQAMADAGRSAGLDELEIERTIQSAFDKTVGVARMIPERAKPSIQVSEKVAPQGATGAETTPPRSAKVTLRDRLLTRSAMRDLPEPTPLIDNVLDRGTIALLFARWSSGKSFIALDWACSVASGKQWFDRPVQREKVLYVAAEGANGYVKRLDAWETAKKTPITDQWMEFLPVPVNLMNEDVDEIVDIVSAGGFGMVIFDTIARCTVGAEENSSKDVGIVVDSMTRIKNATPNSQGVVIGVHHAGKEGKTLRGSSAYEGGMDTMYFAERDGEVINLSRIKRKDGPDEDRHHFKLAPVRGTDSCVLEAAQVDKAGDESIAKLKNIFITMFPDGVGHTELRRVAEEQGMTYSTLATARAQLIREGWLENAGSDGRPRLEMSAGVKAWANRRSQSEN